MKFSLALLGLVAVAGPARADVEIGFFAGAHLFSQTNELGVFDTPNATSQGNAFLPGVRAGVYFNDFIGVEAEFGVLPTNARVDDNHYGVTDLTYRAHAIVQFGAADDDARLVPFAVAGIAAFSIVNSNNKSVASKDSNLLINSSDTDPAEYVGGGLKYRMSLGWGFRVDARLLLPPSSASSGVTVDFEMLASIYLDFARHRHEQPRPPVIEKVVPVVVDDDPDRDGIHGAADKCPNDPEDKDGFEDADGCPDLDNDKDGIPDAQDKCPNEAEDKDGFQDADGCPDLDNDQDGIPDAQDKCPNEAETMNGFQDADGCPDVVPEKLKKFSGAIEGITFTLGSADLAPASFKILDQAIAVLVEFKDVKLEIQGHTDDAPMKSKKFADNTALSQARADSVKAYFVKKGVDESRLVSKGYGDSSPVVDPKGLKGAPLNTARGKNRRVEFKLISSGLGHITEGVKAPTPTPPAPTPAPSPTP
jgi:OOP family OmpA-OmpF porin